MSRDETIRKLQRELSRNGEDVVILPIDEAEILLRIMKGQRDKALATLDFFTRQLQDTNRLERFETTFRLWCDLVDMLTYRTSPEVANRQPLPEQLTESINFLNTRAT